jgi:two-component system NtrC family sensor kinase
VPVDRPEVRRSDGRRPEGRQRPRRKGGTGLLEGKSSFQSPDDILDLLGRAGYAAAGIDGDGRIVRSNEALRRLVRREGSDLIGADLRDLVAAESIPAFEAWLRHAAETGGDGPCLLQELELRAGDGRPVWAQLRRLMLLESPDTRTLVCIFDAMEAKASERKLRSEINFLRNIIHTSQEGIVASDMKGNIILFNSGAEKLLGWKAEEVIGKVSVTALYPPGVAQEIMRKLRGPDFGGVGRLRAQNFIGVHKEGERIPVSLSASIILEDGKEVASVGIFTDLRERTLLRNKVEEMKLQLFQSEKMASLGKLAAGVAHEINNPLTGILLFSHIMKKRALDTPGMSGDVDRIVNDASRCKAIVQELLDFAHQTGHTKSRVDLNRTIERGLFLLGNQAVLMNIEIRKELDPAQPVAAANSTQISQILINLIMNAIDAMPEGGVLTVHTSRLEDDGVVRLEVSDTGVGITKENMKKIFDPFFTTKEVGKGTGLGLSVVYGIVEDHGGRISVRSSPGAGTTFIIDLPMWRQRSEETNV